MMQLSTVELQQKRNGVHDKQIFLVADEGTLSGIQYLNILVGSLETSHASYLYNCQPILSDAAKCIVAAGAILKSQYPMLFHVTFVVHLLLNCAMKVKILL